MVKTIQNSRLFKKSAICPDFSDQPALMCIQNLEKPNVHSLMPKDLRNAQKKMLVLSEQNFSTFTRFSGFPWPEKNPWCIQVFQNPYNPEEAIDGFYLFWFNPKTLDPAKRNDQIKKYVVINKQVVCSHQNIKLVSEVY